MQKKLDIVKSILFGIIKIIFVYIWWVFVLFILSLLFLNVWVLNWIQMLFLAGGLTITVAIAYGIYRAVRYRR